MSYKNDRIDCYLLGIIFVVLGISCTNEKDTNRKMNIQSIEDNERMLKIKLLNGDTIAYLNLRENYIQRDMTSEFLPWAMIMANKFKYNPAYYDVFFCVESMNVYYSKYSKEKSTYLNLLDSSTILFSKQYLMKLATTDSVFVIKTLKDFYKDTTK